MKKSKKKQKHLISKIVGIISLLIYVAFSILLLVLDMVPVKYLTIFFIIFTFLYLLFLLFIFTKNIKNKFRTVAVVFLVLFGCVFGIGAKYLNDTIGFVDDINNKLLQKEMYYVMVLDSSKINSIEKLKNNKIGLYNSQNSESALKKLKEEINVKYEEYKDVEKMFLDLQDGDISAVLINDSIKTLLESEFADMNIKLKEIYNLSISIEKEDVVKIVDVTKKPFNVYVAGGDAFGSISNVTNTDVNMIATVDPINKKVLLTSIPRDYYVNLPSFGKNAYDKLTHAGYYGIEESIKAIENLLDIDINYYVKVNFSTVVGVIDAIGGVDVYSDFYFCVEGNISTCYKKGYNHLNGERALTFARERHSFKDGDIQRVKNQQKVIEAVMNKVTKSTAIITNYSDILDGVSSNFSTNMDSRSINKLIKMQLNDMRMWEIENQNLVGTDYNTSVYTFPNQELYVMKSDAESVSNASEKIDEFMKNAK